MPETRMPTAEVRPSALLQHDDGLVVVARAITRGRELDKHVIFK